jgi:hypothetical protein
VIKVVDWSYLWGYFFTTGTEWAIIIIFFATYPFLKYLFKINFGESHSSQMAALSLFPYYFGCMVIFYLLGGNFWVYTTSSEIGLVFIVITFQAVLYVCEQFLLNLIFIIRFRLTNWVEHSADIMVVVFVTMIAYSFDFQQRYQWGIWPSFEYPAVLMILWFSGQLLAFIKFSKVYQFHNRFNVERQIRIHAELNRRWNTSEIWRKISWD